MKEIVRCPECGTILNNLKNEQHYFCPNCLTEYTRSMNKVDPYTGKSKRPKAYKKKGWTCAMCGRNPAGKKYTMKWMKLCEECYWKILAEAVLRNPIQKRRKKAS